MNGGYYSVRIGSRISCLLVLVGFRLETHSSTATRTVGPCRWGLILGGGSPAASAWRHSTLANPLPSKAILVVLCTTALLLLRDSCYMVMAIRLPSWSYDPPYTGHWEPVTSTINWCEEVALCPSLSLRIPVDTFAGLLCHSICS